MDLTQLRYFMTVVEFQNFTLAAKKCNVSQPALSQQIAKLEKEFGCSLFDRQGRQVTLTRVGHTLRDRAAVILQNVDDTRRQMLDDGRYGTINFAVAPVLGQYLSARILQSVLREFAESNLVFSELAAPDIIRGIEKGDVDVGLLPFPICCGRELEVEPVFDEEIRLAVHREHWLAKTPELSLGELHGETVILLNGNHLFSDPIQDAFQDRNIRPARILQVDNFAMTNYLVALNAGVGFVPSSSVPRHPSGNVIYRTLTGVPIRRRLAICWNPRRYQTQLIVNFMKAIRTFSINELMPVESLDGKGQAAAAELVGVDAPAGPR